ncbi:hypothetical protein B0H15DRAFT_961174 [Mycena belliarum]|uniref:Uncharacterized protein n=1 Tax=Mycena belliarum TaxID=1033014 RepID=A0AAD6UB73_9AGAR|nr:hypothetical protein B0H15DRAFT_961174 [Mycena belliae]
MDLDLPDDFQEPEHRTAPVLSADSPRAEHPGHRRATVEEVEDEDAPGAPRWFEDYPLPAGCVLEELGPVDTVFEAIRRKQEEQGLAPWAPFESEDDWDLARWLSKCGVSGGNINDFLKLKKINGGAKPSYHNTRAYYQKMDALPSGPKWRCESFEVVGDEKGPNGVFKREDVEFWRRDPIECIQELMGNAAFREKMRYAPQKVYRDAEGKIQQFDEMWTGDWWWDLQKLLPEGVTICPVILASDKTQLSRFRGDKQACMRTILAPLVEAGKDGVDMLCSDGNMRKVYPILAAYVADHPEQCLVACCKENRCPKCIVDAKRRGLPVHSALRDPAETIKLMKKHAQGRAPAAFEAQGLRPADPFWKDLPHCDIFHCFTPDLLHQLHKGVFNEHVLNWARESLEDSESQTANTAEIDLRFQAMPNHPSLRHFRLGISLVSQWTGNEFKNMEKVFLGVLNGAAHPKVILAVRGVLDFIYYAHFESHTNASLAKLEEAWKLFHANKVIFETKHIRDDFNIPKIHSMKHYLDMIRALGTADGYNTELSERMHIDCAKLGYAASSKKEYVNQMTRWLMRREAIDRFASYLQWAIPGYLVTLNNNFDDADELDDADSNDSDEDEPADDPLSPPPPYTIAKKAPFPRVSVSSLERDYGTEDFLFHLENLLRSQDLLTNRFSDISASFPVYKRIVVKLPAVLEVSRSTTNDPIRAVCSTPSRGLRKATPAHFDTILAYKTPPVGTPKRLSLEGLCPARVRAIFALPVEYGRLSVPLAYVQWYKPLTQYQAELGMYRISPATHANCRRASIIPVTQIARSCHLIPIFPLHIDRTLTTDDVLDRCKRFYLNCYLRHIDFVLFRGVR